MPDEAPASCPHGPHLIVQVDLSGLCEAIFYEIATTSEAQAHAEAVERLQAEDGQAEGADLDAIRADVERKTEALQDTLDRRLSEARKVWLAESRQRQAEAEAKLLAAVAEHALVIEGERLVQQALAPVFSQAPDLPALVSLAKQEPSSC